MNNVIAPPSATDTVVLSLLNMFSDPEGAKKQIAAYNDARVAAEKAIAQAASVSSANTKEAERLDALATELHARQVKLSAAEAELASEFAAHTARISEHQAVVRAHQSSVKQANTEAARRDAELGRREQALKDREAAADEKHAHAEATRKKHQDALDKMRAAVA